MRLLIAVLVALSLLGLATAAAGYQELASYRDEFNTVSYSGTDGPTPWTTSWTEIGEDDGASTGMVRVESSGNCFGSDCLVFESGLLDSIGAQRFASLKDWDSAQLGYDVSSTNLLSLVNTGTLVVEVTSDGTSWLVVDQYGLGDTPGHRSLNLMQVWLTDGFGVRFRAVALTNATIFVDNVEISGTIAYEDTTTSTTTTSTTTTTRATTTSTATTTTSDTPTTTSGVDSTAPTDGVNQTTSTTTTLAAPTTTTTMSQGVAPPGDEPPTNGLRDSGEALQVGYQAGLFGSFDDDEPEVLAVELSAEYKTAVEMIKTSWVWMLGLAVLVATLIVTGLERHGSFKENVN